MKPTLRAAVASLSFALICSLAVYAQTGSITVTDAQGKTTTVPENGSCVSAASTGLAKISQLQFSNPGTLNVYANGNCSGTPELTQSVSTTSNFSSSLPQGGSIKDTYESLQVVSDGEISFGGKQDVSALQ